MWRTLTSECFVMLSIVYSVCWPRKLGWQKKWTSVKGSWIKSYIFRCRKVSKFRDISRMCSGKTQEVIASLEVSPECWRWVCSMELPLEPILWLSYYYTHEYNARSGKVIFYFSCTMVSINSKSKVFKNAVICQR